MEQLSSLFITAATLMITGMSVVFIFLSILIVVINYAIKPLATKYPDAVNKSVKARKITKSAVSDEISPGIVAAISSSIIRYRADKNQ